MIFSECVEEDEFELVKNDLHYWQNVTLTIIKDNLAQLNSIKENGNTKYSYTVSEILIQVPKWGEGIVI